MIHGQEKKLRKLGQLDDKKRNRWTFWMSEIKNEWVAEKLSGIIGITMTQSSKNSALWHDTNFKKLIFCQIFE